MPTLAEALADARASLAEIDAAGDAEILLAHALGTTRSRVLAFPDMTVAPAAQAAYAVLVAERARGVPVAYLRGTKEFWSLELSVDPRVLVPRPDSELLVELSLSSLRGRTDPHVADLGTGSGAIGLAIASERRDAIVHLVDASAAAVDVARGNAAALGLAQVRVLHGDWCAPLPPDARYDLIVSNPPYLAADDPHLAGPQLAHEPRMALVAGPTGLEALEMIAAQAPARLAPGGWLYLEHGAQQGGQVRAVLLAAGLEAVATHRDLAGHERATGGRANG